MKASSAKRRARTQPEGLPVLPLCVANHDQTCSLSVSPGFLLKSARPSMTPNAASHASQAIVYPLIEPPDGFEPPTP